MKPVLMFLLGLGLTIVLIFLFYLFLDSTLHLLKTFSWGYFIQSLASLGAISFVGGLMTEYIKQLFD